MSTGLSKGAIVTPLIRKKLALAEHLTQSIADHIEEVKFDGNAQNMRKHSYKLLKSVAQGKNKTYHRQKQSLKHMLQSKLRIKK